MSHSICYCEPKTVFAGQVGTWKFVYTTSVNLPKGTTLKFDFLTSLKKSDWELPQTDLKKKNNLIWLWLPNKKVIPAKRQKDFFEFKLPCDIKAHEKFIILVGSPCKDAEKSGNRVQIFNQRKKEFHLFIDPKGKGNYQEAEIFHLDVRGGPLKNILLITPSLVYRNKRFDVIVRFEDEYGNLTNNTQEKTLVELTYENLRDTLQWKLFVPETGFTALPNLYFNEAGTYRIKLKNLKTKEIFFSDPIKCLPLESEVSIYWGTLRGIPQKDDVDVLRYFRDEKAYHFFSSSPFESEDSTSSDEWKILSNQIIEFNEENRFSTLLGFQWQGLPKEEGLRQIVYAKEARPLLRRKDAKYSSLKKIYKLSHPKEMIAIPCLTMAKETLYDFNSFSKDFERVVEIYNSCGSSEGLGKENALPSKISSPEGSINRALAKNCRFGFVAGGFDTRGPYAKFQNSLSAGLTAVISKEHSRDSLFDALYNRSCYATTKERIVLGFFVAQNPMGSEIDAESKPGLLFSRHISGYVSGTASLKEISIVRNGEIYKTFTSPKEDFEFAIDDTDKVANIALTSPENTLFVYYYLRVVQSDGHMAWSSPIWIDLGISQKKSKSK